MLASVHDDYKVTHTYAIFTATLCWIMQRIRNDGDQQNDLRAKALHDELALVGELLASRFRSALATNRQGDFIAQAKAVREPVEAGGA